MSLGIVLYLTASLQSIRKSEACFDSAGHEAQDIVSLRALSRSPAITGGGNAPSMIHLLLSRTKAFCSGGVSEEKRAAFSSSMD